MWGGHRCQRGVQGVSASMAKLRRWLGFGTALWAKHDGSPDREANCLALSLFRMFGISRQAQHPPILRPTLDRLRQPHDISRHGAPLVNYRVPLMVGVSVLVLSKHDWRKWLQSQTI
jgi:hypothetical protein